MKAATITTVAICLAIVAFRPAAVRAAGQDAGPDADARAALASAFQGMARAKLAISEQYAKTHIWAHDASAAGFEAPTGLPGRLAVADGTITVMFDAPASLAGKTLRLVPADGGGNGRVTWTCEAPGFPAGSLPAGCR